MRHSLKDQPAIGEVTSRRILGQVTSRAQEVHCLKRWLIRGIQFQDAGEDQTKIVYEKVAS